MPIEILMPALSPTMTEGNLAKWSKAEGDSVSAGDVLAEIETDKATMEVESIDEGTLGKILVAEGTEAVAVNTPIALLLGEGEDASVLDGYEAKGAVSSGGGAPPRPRRNRLHRRRLLRRPPHASSASEVKATPLARRMADQAGLDIASMAATAPGGKVGKADVIAASGGGGTSAVSVGETGDRIFASPLARRLARKTISISRRSPAAARTGASSKRISSG